MPAAPLADRVELLNKERISLFPAFFRCFFLNRATELTKDARFLARSSEMRFLRNNADSPGICCFLPLAGTGLLASAVGRFAVSRGTSIAALSDMSYKSESQMERWVLTAGLEPTVAESLRNVLEDQDPRFNYRLETFDAQESLVEQYREFTESPEHKWICLLGRGESADFFAKEYYSFLHLRPPHTIILLSPTVTAYHLNQLSCPYLIIHGECDPLLRTVPHSAFDRAIYHHQMRYGDPTTDFVAPADDRYLTVQRADRKELDPLVIRQIIEWLSLTPDLGTAKEGLHARGFRAYATREKKRASLLSWRIDREVCAG